MHKLIYCLVLNKTEIKLKINVYLIPNFNGYCDLIIEYDCPYARNLNLILGRDEDICISIIGLYLYLYEILQFNTNFL